MERFCAAVSLIVVLLCSVGRLEANMQKDWRNSLEPKGPKGPELTLASGGRTDYTILLPAKPVTQDEKAAADLAMWLKQMTGVEFRIVRESVGQTQPGKVISIGRTHALAEAGITDASADLGDEGYAIAAKGEALFLFGGRKRGPIYAVYALLEEDLGCRWYDSGRSRGNPTVDLPNRPEFRFRPVLRRFIPVLEFRDPFYSEAFDATWSLRNRTSAPTAAVPDEWGGRFHAAQGYFVHTYNALVPPSQYFEKHPEYYSELGGKRQPVQLCLTDPEVLKIVTARVREILKNDPNADIISVSPNDGEGYCECSKCKAVDDAEGTHAGTLIRFVNAIGDAVKDEYPTVKISTLTYLGTFKAPKTAEPRDNVAIMFCFTNHWGRPYHFSSELPEIDKTVKDWARLAKTIHIWEYTTDFGNYSAPYPNMPVVTPDMRYYVENHAKGIMLQGAYQSPGGDFAVMRSWVWAKQLWDPSRDTRELMRDFIYGYYREAAEPIWKYQDMLWRKWEAWHRQPDKQRQTHPLVPTRYEYWAGTRFMSEDVLGESLKLFAEAERLAVDPETIRRVKLAKLSVAYAKVVQGLFLQQWDYFSLGTRLRAVLTGEKDETDYGKLISEVEETTAGEQMTRFNETADDVPTIIRRWKDMLLVTEHPGAMLKLASTWKFVPDEKNAGVEGKWYATEFDDSGWSVVRSDNGTASRKRGFPSYGWYRQKIVIPERYASVDRLFLCFLGVDGEPDIYINGKKVWGNYGPPYTDRTMEDLGKAPFGYNVKSAIVPGKENVIAVRVKGYDGKGGIVKPAYLVPAALPSRD